MFQALAAAKGRPASTVSIPIAAPAAAGREEPGRAGTAADGAWVVGTGDDGAGVVGAGDDGACCGAGAEGAGGAGVASVVGAAPTAAPPELTGRQVPRESCWNTSTALMTGRPTEPRPTMVSLPSRTWFVWSRTTARRTPWDAARSRSRTSGRPPSTLTEKTRWPFRHDPLPSASSAKCSRVTYRPRTGTATS